MKLSKTENTLWQLWLLLALFAATVTPQLGIPIFGIIINPSTLLEPESLTSLFPAIGFVVLYFLFGGYSFFGKAYRLTVWSLSFSYWVAWLAYLFVQPSPHWFILFPHFALLIVSATGFVNVREVPAKGVRITPL